MPAHSLRIDMNPALHRAVSGIGKLSLWGALLAAPTFAWAASSCVDAEIAGHSAIEAQHRLQHAPASTGPDADENLSPQQRTATRDFKDALVSAIDARFACSDAHADPAALQRALQASLGVPKTRPEPDDNRDFGHWLDVDVTRNTDPKPLVFVRVGYGIPCGDDNLLVAYAWDGATWRRVLRWQSDDYAQISGAFGGTFQYRVLPAGQIAVAHSSSWCWSRWRSFGLDVFAPASDGQPQRKLLHLGHGFAADFDQDDEGLTLKTRPDGVELRTTIAPLDADLIERKVVYRYRVSGDTVERIQPIALNGRDFVDEWLTSNDAHARNWSDPNAADDLLKARQTLVASLKGENGLLLKYGPVRACGSGKDRYQVEIDLQAQKSKHADARYGLIHQESNGFTMLSLSDKADPTCKGANLMAH
jgi:hypothetical protein